MNNGRHSGEVALVTGANKGIGREIARRLAAEGVTVYLGARDEDRGRRAARDLAGDAADVRVLQLDVTDQAQIDAAVKRVDEEFGRLDVLVNNAGIGIEWGDAVEEVTVEQVRRTYEVNVFGVVAMTRACIPLLRRSAAARVVNLSSPLGSLGLISDTENPVSDVGMLAYSSSKTALNSVTLLYANALRKDGILVNAASPGFVATDLNDHRGHLTAEQGADLPAKLALLGADGSTGTFLGHPSGTFLGHDDSSVEEVVVPW
jgi:NAD(P)-dependent dehydrogenase (short-subunit alcohol dehydrogenase family)